MNSVSITEQYRQCQFETKDKRTAGQNHGDLRVKLLREGLLLLYIHGIESVTIRAVALNASVAHSTSTNHFPLRRTILIAIITIMTINKESES